MDSPTEILVSCREMGEYCRVNPRTIYNWILKEGFPASKRPDGKWITSRTLIDNWILARQGLGKPQKNGRDNQRKDFKDLGPSDN